MWDHIFDHDPENKQSKVLFQMSLTFYEVSYFNI